MLESGMQEAQQMRLELRDYTCTELKVWLRLIYTGTTDASDWDQEHLHWGTGCW